MMKYFRIDPHEFPTQREFFFDKVRIAADDESNGKFALTWSASDPDDNRRSPSTTTRTGRASTGRLS